MTGAERPTGGLQYPPAQSLSDAFRTLGPALSAPHCLLPALVQLAALVFECLAERTIALAQLRRRQEPQHGYVPLLEARLRAVLRRHSGNAAPNVTAGEITLDSRRMRVTSSSTSRAPRRRPSGPLRPVAWT